jgi:ribonuclease HI
MNKTIEIYTDGSSLGNPGRGGWGAVVVEKEKIIEELGGHDKDTTNNRMELQAAIEAIKYINKKHKECIVTIHADSSYVLGGVTNWIFGWEKNGWRTANKKPVMNQDLWKELIGVVRESKANITWQKVKGHSGHVYNDKADEIATTYAANQK